MTKRIEKGEQPIDVAHVVGVVYNDASIAKERQSPDTATQALRRLMHIVANVPGAADTLASMHEAQQKERQR
jgi:hypothetical protein